MIDRNAMQPVQSKMRLMSVRPAARVLALGLALAIGCASQGLAGGAGEPKASMPAMVAEPSIRSEPPLQLQVKAKIEAAIESLRRNVQVHWGATEVRVADKTTYVKYSADYTSRVIMDFRQGALTVETLDGPAVQRALESTLVEALRTSDDPASVELFSDAPVRIKDGERPYLYGLVLDAQGRPIETHAQAQRFARQRVSQILLTRQTSGQATVRFILVPLVRDYEAQAASRYQSIIQKYAIKWQVSAALVQATAYMESRFNPFAISPIPTFGLMQLVPSNGLMELYFRVSGVRAAPPPSYLADPDHSIEMGVALLAHLSTAEFGSIVNQGSRDLCVIASYKVGARQVYQTFGQNRNAALAGINSLESAAVYERLRTALPSAEGRDYVGEVSVYRQKLADTTAR